MSSQGIVVLGFIGLSVLLGVFGGDRTNDDTYIVYDSGYTQDLNIEENNNLVEGAGISISADNLIPDDYPQEGQSCEPDVLKESSSSSMEPISHYQYDEKERDYELDRILAEYEKTLRKLKESMSRISEYQNTTYAPIYSNDYIRKPVKSYENNVNSKRVYVNGYYKSNGTYVEPYIRTAPNSSIDDNFTYHKNYNPYTGKKGSIYN